MSAAQDLMEAAGHAYTTLQPLLGPLNAHLQIVWDIGTTYDSLQLWVHPNAMWGDIIHYKTGLKTKQDVDDFVDALNAKASIPV